MALLSHYQTRFALICSIALVVILIAINAFRPLNELVLDYDEVDYMQAANLQIDDLYLGTSTLNFVEFMKLGYKKLKGGIFSVALAMGLLPPPVRRHPTLWSPDFPLAITN